MSTTLRFKPIIDLPEWRPVAPSPAGNWHGMSLASDLRNNLDRSPFIYYLSGNTGFHAYHIEDDDWITLGSPALAGTFNTGVGAVFAPSHGPRGVLAAGNTTASIVLSTALPAAVAPNQLANRGDGRGFRIRIIGNTAGGSGQTAERLIVANTGGTTPTVTLDSPLPFTPQAGDAFEFHSGRVYLLGSGTVAAGIWKFYDVATNSFSANLATANLPASITNTSESNFIALDELYVPWNANPGEGYCGELTAAASAAGSITGPAAGGDAAVLANEYRNFQVRIVRDTTTPTSVGQRRNIASHTAGPSAVYTLSANWTVTPSPSAVFVIENNSDRILLWTSVLATTFTYNIAANAWDTTTFAARPAVVTRGCMALPSFFIRPDAAKNARHSHIFAFRGESVILDLFDIAGGANGLWTANIAYGGSGGVVVNVGTCATPDPHTGGGRFAFINVNASQRFLRFDVVNRTLTPAFFLRYPQGGTAGGNRMATVLFVDGATKLTFLMTMRATGSEAFQIAVQK